MTSNVACSTQGCTNPVVGQCSGYKGSCGRFYCAEHSKTYMTGSVFCSVCAEKNDRDWEERQREAEIQRVYKDYVNSAKAIKNRFVIPLILTFVACVIPMSFIATLESVFSSTFWCFALPFAGVFAIIMTWIQQKEMARVMEIDKVKPGFEEFYKAWKKQQNAEASQLLGSLAVGAAMAGAEEFHRRERIRSDVRVAKDEWRKR